MGKEKDKKNINSHRPPNPELSSSELAKIFGEDPSFSTYSENSGAINPLVIEDSKTGEIIYTATGAGNTKFSDCKMMSLCEYLKTNEISKLVHKSPSFKKITDQMTKVNWIDSFYVGLVDGIEQAQYSDYYNIIYIDSSWRARRSLISVASEATYMLKREEVFSGETPLNQDDYLQLKMNQKTEALLNQSLVNREIDQNTLFKLPRDYDACISFRKRSKDKTKTIKLVELLKTNTEGNNIDLDKSFDNIMNFICSALILKDGKDEKSSKFMNYILHYESYWKEEYKPNYFRLKQALKSKSK